jgi:16S rRNA (uracil1498-N3)-methyltransferase
VPGLAEGERALERDIARHLRVLRLGAGEAFVAFDPAAHSEADAKVLRVEGDRIVVSVGTLRPGRLVMSVPIAWIQGLAKADKCDAIVRDATELGATRFTAAFCARGVVRLDAARAEARRSRWERIAEQAARQCGRADPPEITGPRSWLDALEIAPEGAGRFCLYEKASQPLAPLLARAIEAGVPLAFAAGPEGGLEPAEVLGAESRGFCAVSLGPLVLRTETVAAAVLGAVRIFG